MIHRNFILSTLAKLKPSLAERYHVTRLALVGSFARNEANEASDVDIATDAKGIDLFDLVEIREMLQSSLQKKVDVIILSPYMNPYLRDKIKKEAIYV